MKTRPIFFFILLLIPLLFLISCSDANSDDLPNVLEELEGCAHEYAYKCESKCSLCGAERKDFEKHTYNSNSKCRDIICTVCKAVKEQSHNYVAIDYSLENQPNLLSGKTVDEKCTKCNNERKAEYPAITPEDVGMSAIYITDYVEGATKLTKLQSKNEEIVVKFKYESGSETTKDFECVSKIKIQGASSAHYPKKNYTIKLFEDDSLENKNNVDFGWGKQNKYCLKANYIDSSHARNIVGARLASQVAATRANINSTLASSPNYGLIDGFPVLVYVNGEFHGLYTLNIPKDNWQFSMKTDESLRQALLMADSWTDSVKMKEPISEDITASGWDIEHCSTADESWIRESFNELIELINCGDQERILRELPERLDIDSAIDNFILTYTMNAGDNQSKNILWATYDGKLWIPSMYDMDATFGSWWNGTPIGTPGVVTKDVYPSWNEDGSYDIPGNASKMYHILIQYYGDRVEARWTELRQSIITAENITSLFDSFLSDIPDVVFYSESLCWKDIPYAELNRSNMYKPTEEQIIRLDDFFCNMT
jgi:hypothetical protein